jgi:adenosylcobinamide-GDP ribazoletransferase
VLRRSLEAFLVAIGFLTIIPIRSAGSYDPRTIGRSLAWFPAVGLLIGCALAAVDRLAGSVFTPSITVALVLATGAALTGALHLDGLADTADGVFGGRTPERRLEIMRDSRIGSYGLVAVVLALLLQYSALGSIGNAERWRALLIVPALSRAGMVLAIAVFPYARPAGLGRTFKDHASNIDVVVAYITVLVAAVFIMRGEGIALLLASIATTLAAGWFLTRRIGGITGDSYGAIAVLIEVLLFLAVAADWLG